MAATPPDLALVFHVSVEIERLAQADARGQGRRFANGFRRGAVDGVMTAMEVSKAAARGAAKAAGASAAIVLVDAREAEADALMREKNPKLRTVSFGGRVQRDGYERVVLDAVCAVPGLQRRPR